MTRLRKAGLIVGLLALAGSLPLIFHPVRITTPITQGPPRDIVILWQSPFGQLGILAFLVGSLMFFSSLPNKIRPIALGAFLALSSIGLSAGFYFNDFRAWWWHTFWLVFPGGIIFAIAGGFLVANTLRQRSRLALWVVLLVFAVTAALTIGLLAANQNNLNSMGFGYYSYDEGNSQIYSYYHDYNGDYLIYFFIIAAFQVFVGLGLFAGFVAGLVLKRSNQ